MVIFIRAYEVDFLMKNSRLPISVVLLTRNEERNVSECLQSCDFAEEIVVVDDDSSDQTVAIAESLGARVFHRSLNGDWGPRRLLEFKRQRVHGSF